MFFFLLCSLVLAANLPIIDDYEDKSDAREQKKQERESFGVGEAQSGSSSVSIIDVEEMSASIIGDGGEEIADANNNAVSKAQSDGRSRHLIDTEEENTSIGDYREETAVAKSRAVSEEQARNKIGRVIDVVGEDGFFSVPLNSEDTAPSRVNVGETYFNYERLKTSVLSEEGVSESFIGEGSMVITAEGVDGKKYRWRIAKEVGRGAYSSVYRADNVENLPVANTHSSSSPSSSSSIDTMASVAIKIAWSDNARVSLLQEANRLNRMKNTPGVPQLVSVILRALDQSTGLIPQFGTERSWAASVWDKNLLSFMNEIRADDNFVNEWITLWSKILNAAPHSAGLSDEISRMFGMTCYVL